jgi:hypothetical protein
MGELDNIKGLSSDDLKKIQGYIDNAYSKGKSDGTKTSKSYGGGEGDLDVEKTYVNNTTDLSNSADTFAGILKDFKDAADPTNFKGADYLRDRAQEMSNELGLGQARMSEIKTTIADALPEMIKLGVSESDALKAMTEIPKDLGVNTSLGKEALVEMAAASNVAGVSASKMALEFKGVGMSLYDVGDRMAEVANYAKSVGVNVKAVSADVVSNLKQLNLFNFDSGVKGLAKMASQASMLGFSMEKTFKLADDLMSPEKAIDLSASLQRLGVASSALLDPLKAMDLAQNDPEALQKEMINISKEFTKLKADGSGFEILPGAKRRLREIAPLLGMNADELANMSIKSADLDMKMSKIKFPSFAASEEDKMLIANMSQMKGGEAVLQIRNDITGKMDDINVKDLTADQITKLKEQQSNENKTIEQIALDQLTALQQINKSISGSKVAVDLGKATTPTMDRFYNVMNKTEAIIATNITKDITTENVRGAATNTLGPLEQEMIRYFKGETTWKTVETSLTSVKDSLVSIAGDIVKSAGNAGIKTVGDVTNMITKEYSPLGVQPTQIVMDPSSPFATQIQSLIEQFKTGGPAETKTTVSGDVNHTLTIKGDGGTSLSDAEFNKKVLNAIVDPTIKSQFDKLYVAKNSGLGG